MDIPKQPVKSVLSHQASAETSTRQQASISDISALNLKPGKNYPAQVIHSRQSQEQLAAATPTPRVEPKSQPSETPILQKNEYLVRVNAKTILISSEKLLDIGQKLFLALDPKAIAEKPSLIAQLVGQGTKKGEGVTFPGASPGKLSANIQSATSSLLNAVLTPTTLTSAKQTLNSPQAISQLLQALNLTLDKQIPLQDGFKYIEPLLSSKPTTTPSQIEPALRLALQNNLLTALTQSSEIINQRTINQNTINQSTMDASTLSLNTAGTTLKTALLNSGLFLEQSLTSQPGKLQAFKAQIEAIQTQLSQSASNTQTNADASARQNALSASLNKIQQTIELLMQTTNAARQGTSTHGLASSGQLLTEAAANGQDLKASLLSVASTASRLLAKELSAEALKSLFMLPRTEEYALSPFAFPLLQANKLQSAKNLFEKQEFTTGQMLKLLAGMIHRLQFNQLHSLLQSNSAAATDTALQQSWFFELPVVNPQQQVQTFNFRIDKEAQQTYQEAEESEKSIQWKLLLSFDLDELGPIYVQVKLQQLSASQKYGSSQQHTISSVLWADQAGTVKLLQSEAAYFKAGLESIGLNVSDVRCEQGQPTQTQTKLDRHLVDTKA